MFLKRTELIQEIAQQSTTGNLGLFIGSGFSRAATLGAAPDWKTLLQKVSDRMGVEFDFSCRDNIGKSCPKIASEIIQLASDKDPAKYHDTLNHMRSIISELSSFSWASSILEPNRILLQQIKPKWVITTNYDFIIEELLLDDGICLSPNDSFIHKTSEIPIFHLHGHRYDHPNIIVTEEDYIELFRPMTYRQIKLATLLAESSCLFLGYSFGDINVLHALDLAKGFGLNQKFNPLMVQALWNDRNPKEEPYRGQNDMVFIETQDIFTLLSEIAKAKVVEDNKQEAIYKERDEFSNFLVQDVTENIQQFATDHEFRNELLSLWSNAPVYFKTTAVISFIGNIFDTYWSKARSDGGWDHYKTIVHYLLDIFIKVPFKSLHPALVRILFSQLAAVSEFLSIETDPGYSGMARQASIYWHKNKAHIPEQVKNELIVYAKSETSESFLKKL